MSRKGKKQISLWIDESLKKDYELLVATLGLNTSNDLAEYVLLAVTRNKDVIDGVKQLRDKLDIKSPKFEASKK